MSICKVAAMSVGTKNAIMAGIGAVSGGAIGRMADKKHQKRNLTIGALAGAGIGLGAGMLAKRLASSAASQQSNEVLHVGESIAEKSIKTNKTIAANVGAAKSSVRANSIKEEAIRHVAERLQALKALKEATTKKVENTLLESTHASKNLRVSRNIAPASATNIRNTSRAIIRRNRITKSRR